VSAFEVIDGLLAARRALALALFEVSRALYAFGDRLAALRDRMRPSMPASTMLAYAAVGVMAAIFVNDMIGPTPAVSSVTSVPEQRPEWIEIPRPHGAFALDAHALEGLEASFSVRRHRTGGGRKDEFTFGAPGAGGAYVRISAYRPAGEGMAEPDPFQAVVALASESGIEGELQETSGKLKTKFGALPVVQMTVAGRNGPRSCLAVAGGWNDPRFGLVAWWCNDGPEMVSHGKFACVIDRLSLMSAGGDDHLAEFFARIELRRNFCEAHSSFVSPTPRLVNDWMHPKRGPELRGRILR
jgi:hypothetical protein